MKISRSMVGILVILILLILGWINFRTLDQTAINEQETSSDNRFRTWLWTNRQYDLILQIVLIFSGMLSIAAILPIKEQDE